MLDKVNMAWDSKSSVEKHWKFLNYFRTDDTVQLFSFAIIYDYVISKIILIESERYNEIHLYR